MKNVSDSCVRFVWCASNDITFSPKVGHIQKHKSKQITVSFSSEKPTKYIGTKVICQISKIELNDVNSSDWDDSQKMITFVHKNEISPESNDNSMISVASIKPEPPYTLQSSSKAKELSIKIFVISDIIKFTVDTTEISFSPTMMYQSRYSELHITNTSQIRFEYQWMLNTFESLRTDYAQTRPSPFVIEPSSGIIEAGQTSTFRVTFLPMEVDDFTATYKCVIPYFSGDPICISLNGLSRRPFCHFNVETSDYLTRRHPDFTYQLPDNVKVIEIFSKGIGIKVNRKIDVINPTSTPYETHWSAINDSSSGAITCDGSNAFIPSGKHYNFYFTYNPQSVKTVECLYEFKIDEHDIKVYFLFVGRISH